MTKRGIRQKLAVLGATAIMAIAAAGCGSEDPDPTGEARVESLEAQVENEEQGAQVRAIGELIENFREGPTPPEGWPADQIPVPPGAKPVASLQRSTLPNGAQTISMFYVSDAPPADTQRSFRTELPKKGWVEVQAHQEGEMTTVTAQNDDFNGLFMAGPIPSVPRLESGERINVMVILTEPDPTPPTPAAPIP